MRIWSENMFINEDNSQFTNQFCKSELDSI